MHNIFVAADRGAEYSPVHLHAMPSVANLEGIDGVLAGSYGDSIGRAEYSGTHASDLRPILAHDLNQFSMLNSRIEKQARKVLLAELVNSRQRFPGRTEQQYREIEMQMHYMNRQLNPCLSVIDDAVPVQQMFTSLPIVSYIWNLSFASRTDQVYRHLLNELDSRLLELPWARTGRLYSSSTPSMHDDSLSSLNNHYGRWLRHDLRQYITEMIRSGYLQQLNIFSEKALEKWVRRWSRSMRPRADRLDEKMAWLASLALFVKKHEVQGLEESFERTARDGLVLTFSQVRYLVYQVYLAAKNK